MDPLKDDPYACNILGVDYFLPWDALPPEGSFFLPTTVRVNDVATMLRRKARHAGLRVAVRQWCEFGVYGVRVWRLD